MATPPYGRRSKGRGRRKHTPGPGPATPHTRESRMPAATPHTRQTRPPAATPKGPRGAYSGPKATPPPGGRNGGSVTNGMSGGVKPLAGGSRSTSGAKFTSHAGAGSRPRVGPKPATGNVGADTKPKSPRPVAGAKGPHPSLQAIAHAAPNARFKRTPGPTAPAPTGLQGRAKKVRPLVATPGTKKPRG